jgi:hypothetical protein
MYSYMGLRVSEIGSWWTIVGSGSLKASDEEVDKGKSVAPVAAAGGSGDNSGEYEIENAKSSRSVCKSCHEKIEKGHVRKLAALYYRTVNFYFACKVHLVCHSHVIILSQRLGFHSFYKGHPWV